MMLVILTVTVATCVVTLTVTVTVSVPSSSATLVLLEQLGQEEEVQDVRCTYTAYGTCAGDTRHTLLIQVYRIIIA